jgi:protocatechuate 3,4-dioxygenase beta subunit
MEHEMHDHDRGLAFDLSTLYRRRRMLGLFGAAGLATLAGCATSNDNPTPAATTAGNTTGNTTGNVTADCSTKIPQETAGPFPGDGSNGPNVLTQSGIVRSDIRSSFGSSGTVARGIPLTVVLSILDSTNGCKAYAGAAVYIWHCDIDGNYSLYSSAAANENYLRGVQAADASGKVTFQTIFPAAYSGRWPHIHFEVYPSVGEATAAGKKLATSQLALPKDVCDTVYATTGYEQSVRNMTRLSLDTDMVFRDGYRTQLATVNGSASSGYSAALGVPV